MSREILYEHYKDSCERIRDREKQRDRLFLIVVGLLGLLVLALSYSVVLHAAIPEINLGAVKIKLTRVPITVLLSTVWTFLAALTLRYYQVTLDIEKKYDNLHALEQRLSASLGDGTAIDRESAGYITKKGKWFRHWAWVFYTAVFPVVVISIVVWAIANEVSAGSTPLSHRVYDIALAAFTLVSVASYLGAIWVKRSNGA
ncbi:hypothetical protein [Thiohalocapsa halophila]|uniref:hypothetical protein n=1 Tax=Thiohalocapsa halophila TaxID=69359 RepID=UPI001904071F|nr:hypothetical protein [Thiohalocapsa halophila]